MKKMLVAFLAALALVFGVVAPSPAYALPTVSGGHWSYFKWPGFPPTAVRAFYLLDRSGDATVHAALQQVVNDLAYDLSARQAWGYVPAITLIQEDQWVGVCDSTPFSAGNGFQNFGPGYSFALVCSGGPANGSSITWSSGGHQAESYHPSIHLDRYYGDYNTTYSALAHELLHVYGLGHTNDCNDLMGGVEYGCKLKVGVLKHPSPADFDALTNFYGGYNAWGHPWYA